MKLILSSMIAILCLVRFIVFAPALAADSETHDNSGQAGEGAFGRRLFLVHDKTF